MKNLSSLIYVFIVLSVINIFAILFYSQAKSQPVKTILTTATGETISPVTSDVPMPAEMLLAGEKVPLHRLDIQEAFKKELIVNTYLHSHTLQILKNAPRIFSRIEPILEKAGIPDDFKYLAVIESQLNPLAVSPVGATGLWQFMEGTGKELNLEINPEIDERYHIEKSTEAAANYLKKAYLKFGSWTMAAASYNAGVSMVSKQMDIQKEKNYYDLLLGEETGRYVFRILALKQIMTHPELYHFQAGDPYDTEKIQKVKITGPVSDWADFAQKHGITYKTLKRFNPWLRKSDLKNRDSKTYEIDIPVRTELYK